MSTSLTPAQPAMPSVHSVERQLARVGSRIEPELLPLFGVRRQPEREASSHYYLVQATPRGLALRQTNRLVRLEMMDGTDLYVTIPFLDQRLIDQCCWIVVTTHEGEGWLHRHILQIWPVDALPPASRRDRRPASSPGPSANVGGQQAPRRTPRRKWAIWRSLPARHILAAEELS